MSFLRSLYNFFFGKKKSSTKSERRDLVELDSKVETSLDKVEINFLRSLGAIFKKGKREGVTTISIPLSTFESKVSSPTLFNFNCNPLKGGKLSRGEEACLETLQNYYKKPFYRVRPNFLRNPETGKNLEIDCFNAELGIGCEYNGKQHYHYPSFPGDTEKAFVKRVKRDLYKIETCKLMGIYLLVVPYTVKEEEIDSFILSRLPGKKA